MKCRHGVCRMSEHCGEGKCGWFEPAETRISSVQPTALLAAAVAVGNLCRKHTPARVAQVRDALKRLDDDWMQHRQNG
jgi:hypothetical protein